MFTSFGYQAPSIITRNLVVHYDPADRTSFVTGSTLGRDLTQYNHTGSLINGAIFTGSFYGVNRMDGSNDGFRRTFQAGDLYHVSASRELTVDFWWKWNTTVRSLDGGLSFGNLFGNNTAGDFQWQLGKHISGTPSKVYFFFQIANTTQIRTLAQQSGSAGGGFDVTDLTNNTWYNFCYTCKSPDIVGYINGVNRGGALSGTYPTSLAIPTTVGRRIFGFGCVRDDNLYGFAGDFGPVKVYNRALDAAEVRQNFNAVRHRYGV